MVQVSRQRLKSAAAAVERVFRERWSPSDGNGSGIAAEEQPFRAELFSISQLELHARTVAQWHKEFAVRPMRRGQDLLLPRLASNEHVFRETYDLLTDALKRGRRVTPAAEWFLDNYYLIEDQIRTARRHLPRRYNRELPRLAEGPSAGYPRVYDIALELISHADGRVDAESLRAFVTAYQSVNPLRLGELWAIPIMLRLALLENLRRVAIRVMNGRRERELAESWVERMVEASSTEPAKLVLVLAAMVKQEPPLTPAFASEFASRLHGQGPALILATTWLEQRLAEQGQSTDSVFQQASQNQASDQVSIGNSIGSLRFLGASEWREFVESMSLVEHALRKDPIYPGMDFDTRDQYRHVIEALARRGSLAEEEVARRAVELAAASSPAGGDGEMDVRGGRRTHVGFYLVDRGRSQLERAVGLGPTPGRLLRGAVHRFSLPLYIGSIGLATVGATWGVLLFAARHGVGLPLLTLLAIFLLIATSQFAVTLVQWAATLLLRPRLLPRLDFSGGIPGEHRTAVAVPTLLTDRREVEDLLAALEVRFLANQDPNLCFVLLSDFRDAPTETMPGDEELLRQASEGIEALNAKYGDRETTGDGNQTGRRANFLLLHRPRKWNPQEGVWMAWERKRGKLEEFNAALRGRPEGFATIVGPIERLQGTKYVITLDSDTQLPRDSARQLIGTLAHPLNRPYYDEKLGRVSEGYGILQPRVGISMPSAARSRFSRLFAGEPGIDPYTRAVSDVYQDLFQEGSFIGKGIYDVDAFQRSIGGHLPENRVLSHDLLEGAYARAGLVSDVSLFEDFPSAYPAEISRRYRWVRGDWQISPWLLPRVPGGDGHRVRNPISALSRWKLLDNMRRSLVPPALLAVLVLGWFLPIPLFYSLAVVAMFLLPALLSGATELARRPSDRPGGSHGRLVARSVARTALREAFALACLPYEALISVEAIGRSVTRMFFTGRGLLEWRTARDAQRSARTDLLGFYRSMWVAAAAAAFELILLFFRTDAVVVAAPLLGMWLLSPTAAWWLSWPLRRALRRLAEEDSAFLRMLARRTWRFFETVVTAEDNHLPPDNYQEEAGRGIAHRTSPTNIGLSLLATLTAYDFGYVPAGILIARTSLTLGSIDKLQRYRGHLYNWYDTQTLQPLRPLYVSTVDSGNLAGHLLTLAAGLRQLVGQPIIRPAVFAGLIDTLNAARGATGDGTPAPQSDIHQRVALLRDELRAAPQSLSDSRRLLLRMATAATDLAGAVKTVSDGTLKSWIGAFQEQCRQAIDDLAYLAPWTELEPIPDGLRRGLGASESVALNELLRRLDQALTLGDLVQLDTAVSSHLETISSKPGTDDGLSRLRAAITLGSERAAQRLSELRLLADKCRELSDIDYDFLYDETRQLLAIGYNAGEHRRDPGFYDLLASEARLGSFIAIAQGKLPQKHWFSMGRLLTAAGGKPALLSWSGSMFEYLMPLLVMPTYDGTLLDETYKSVVDRQIAYGHERHVPWGISESGYAKFDAQLNYQYRAFGVPGLGLKRGLAEDLVVAPYASAMALMVNPESACANLRRLAGEGRLAEFGFYEAIDYTPSRLPPGQDAVVIRSFMAHHQGMALLSLAYLLLDRPMQRRFGSEPTLRATELLLQERVPQTALIEPHLAEVSDARGGRTETGDNFRAFRTPQTANPETHLLSNGRYSVVVTAAGGGYSHWRDLAVTRWHEDHTRDCWGTFCYLRDVRTGEFWSAAYQPTLKRPASYEATYSQGKAEFRRRDGEIETHVELAVSPEDNIELRRISITNRGRTSRTIELTSFAEVVLALQAADSAHPAFSNLFVQTELVRERQAILCTRRPRSAGEHPPWMMHLMTVHGTAAGTASFETSRADFVGRGRSVADPAAMYRPALGDSEGAVLDPVVAIRNSVLIGPDETVRIHLVTGVAETREHAIDLVEKYHDRHLADRVFELAWTHDQVVLRQLDIAESEAQLYGRLASSILYANPSLRASASIIARNRRGQSGLWAYGISGDLPIVLLRVGDQASIGLVHQLLSAHAYWRGKGLQADLVIWNEDQSGYRQVLHEQIMGMITSGPEASLVDRPGGIFVRRIEQMSEEDKVLLQTVARVIISDTAGTLVEQVNRRARPEVAVPRFNPIRNLRPTVPIGVELPNRDLAAFNGFGGFTRDGREYVITTTPETPTPAPWVNVLANPWFGSVVSESGSAYTWCENAQTFRLTPWYNDAVADTTGEAWYVRDEQSGRFYSPSPLPARGPMPYTSRHGFGYSVFEYTEDGISSEMSTYVATDAPVKFVVFKFRNSSGRARRLSIAGFFELILGERRSSSLMHVVTEIDPKTQALLARNAYNPEFGERIAFLDCSETGRTVSGDREEFLGRNGTVANPACMSRSRLSGRVGAALDPCASMQVMVDLADGQEREIAFTLGCGRDLGDVRQLVNRFRGTMPARAALEGVWGYWNWTLGAVHVETPDPSLNFLTNGWLMYQVLACRVWGRSGFYQSGGAFGFRDQLQDVMALVHAEPAILREHLLRSAARQFKEGDVQHWWHPPLGRGVRTRISDDFLWLPYATCRYVAAIGDTGVLDEKIQFLDARPVTPEEDSYYDLPVRAAESGTLYEHCVRAIRHGLRFGEHGLPLMGCGDWNDGMNLVGAHGKGESVWLAFFLNDVLVQFSELAKRRQDAAFAELCTSEALKLRQNIAQHTWDGEWYRRAYFDDGRPLGSSSNPECKIDSLPQSWSVLTGADDPARSRAALDALDARLVRQDLGVIQLFDPPFDSSDLDPGYVKGYVPGVRENGGQYTHAAVWAVMAFAAAGDGKRAWELFRLINPVRHGENQVEINRYKVEPYVVAADVYTNPQHAGRGGWTWYTGSAAWMYRLITESLLGLQLKVDRLRVAPLMPSDWESFKVHYRYRQTTYHIQVRRLGEGQRVTRVAVDGINQPDLLIPLIDDRRDHMADVEIGGQGPG